ncbi:MAG TPA: AsmA family protein [Terriglobales bacterium]|nr:AsmA family protein [Terriglobales bacterium]
MKRKGLFILAAVVIVILLVAILLPLLVDANKFRPMIEAELRKSLDREVHIGNLKLSLLAGGVTAEDISISDDPAFSREPFLKAKSVDVGVEMVPLIFSRTLNVRSLAVNEPQVTMLRTASGKWNYSSMGGKKDAKKPAAPQAAFSVGVLKIKDGRIQVGSVPARGKPRVYEDVNLTIKDLSSTSVMPLELAAKTPGGGSMKVEGSLGPLNPDDAAATPLKADVKVEHMDLASTGFLDPSSGLAGLLDYSGKLDSDGKVGRSTGKATVAKLRVAKGGAPARTPVSLDYATEYDYKRQAGSLTRGNILTGKSTAKLSGTYDTRGESPVVHMKLNGSHLPVDDVEGLLPAFGVVLPSGAALRGGTVDANLSLDGPIDRLVISGPVNVSNTTLTGYNLASKMSAISALAGIRGSSDTVIQTLSSNLQVSPEGIRTDNLNIIVPSIGTVTGAGTISASNALNYKMNAKLNSGGMLGGVSQLTSFGQAKGTVPFLIQGTTSNPIFIPNVAGAMGNTMAAPAEGLGGALGGLFGKKKNK